MKKLLLPIFGGFLLVTSVSLTTGQNVNNAVKIAEKEKAQTDTWYQINSKSDLNEKQIKEIAVDAQSWDDQAIDRIVNQALQYQDHQLTIDDSKLDATKLPAQVLAHINLALANLNQAVASGFIDVVMSNDNIQLLYPNNATTFSSSASDIVYFDSPTITSFSAYMWYSTYGPSHWWKFWEWGGFIHFSEQAVKNAKWFNLAASVVNIYFIFKNIRQIENIVSELSSAWNTGNIAKSNLLIKDLANILGSVDLSLLGDVVDILAIFIAIVMFIGALLSTPGVGTLILAFIEMVASIIVSVTNQMLNADRGYGVKWQWANFIIPLTISAE